MAGMSQKQWLNIIIFVISVLFILALLLNKKMQSSQLTPDSQIENKIELNKNKQTNSQAHAKLSKTMGTTISNNNLASRLIMIEFSQAKIITNNGQWFVVGEVMTKNKIKSLTAQWQHLLNQKLPIKKLSQEQGNHKNRTKEYSVKNQVKLYFSQRQQPIEVSLVEQKLFTDDRQSTFFYISAIDVKLPINNEDVSLYFP